MPTCFSPQMGPHKFSLNWGLQSLLAWNALIIPISYILFHYSLALFDKGWGSHRKKITYMVNISCWLVPGVMLSTQCERSPLFLVTAPCCDVLRSPFYRRGDRGLKMWDDLPRVSLLANDRYGHTDPVRLILDLLPLKSVCYSKWWKMTFTSVSQPWWETVLRKEVDHGTKFVVRVCSWVDS